MKTGIMLLFYMMTMVCFGSVHTNMEDGIVWQYADEHPLRVIGAHLVGRHDDGCKPRCVRIPSELHGRKVEVIGKKAFEGNPWLGELQIPDCVCVVDDFAFSSCSNLTRVAMLGRGENDGVKQIGYSAFYNCINLESVVFADGLDYIECEAFCNCAKLKEVSFPMGLTSLGAGAFSFCKSLEKVKLWWVMEIGDNPFANCVSLNSVEVESDNEWFTSDSDGILWSKDKKVLITYPPARTNDTYSVPVGVRFLPSRAFSSAKHLKNITLPSSLEMIPPMGFCHSGLEHVTIPDNVKWIGECAFSGTALTNVVMGKKVEKIGGDCFYKCSKLREIHFRGCMPECQSDAFAPSNCILYVARNRGWEGVFVFHGCTVQDDPCQNSGGPFWGWFVGIVVTVSAFMLFKSKITFRR